MVGHALALRIEALERGQRGSPLCHGEQSQERRVLAQLPSPRIDSRHGAHHLLGSLIDQVLPSPEPWLTGHLSCDEVAKSLASPQE